MQNMSVLNIGQTGDGRVSKTQFVMPGSPVKNLSPPRNQPRFTQYNSKLDYQPMNLNRN